MSDEQRRRPEGGSGDDQPPLDDTGRFDPFVDDEAEPPRPPAAGETAIMPGGLPAGGSGDETRQIPPSGERPRLDQTRMIPPVTGDGGEIWSGRAEVRAPRPVPMDSTAVGGWAPVAAEPRGKWWMPILIGVAALLLVGLVGYGVFVLTSGSGTEATPAASSAAPAVTTPSAAPTSEEPSPEPTTARPSPTEAGPVPVPRVIGMNSAAARRALDEAGLTYRLRFRSTSDEPAGTVIDTDPAVGTELAPGTTVELVIADEVRTTAPASPSPTPTEIGERPEG